MNNIVFISIALPCILESKGRLLIRTTEKAIVSKNDDFKSVSITKHCLHDHENRERKGRSSMEVDEIQNGTNAKRSIQKAKIPLVKKPIPTYVELDYEEYYQTRMVRWPEKFTDSSENEDEDFNVDDYEFDVNHDEYATRGKPLEPRHKAKVVKNYANAKAAPEYRTKPAPAEIKVVDEVVTPENKSANKREEITEKSTKKPSKDREDDYYDEFTTKASEKIVKVVYAQEDAGEETDDSREYERRSSIRTIRSPWDMGIYMAKLGEKTSLLVNRVLSILPMFPQIPQRKKLGEDVN